MKNLTGLTIILLFIVWIMACKKLENTIDISLETSENNLVVECYLEAGQPYRLLLTETKDYFDATDICPFVRNAIVIISHNGIRDTLEEALYIGNGCGILPFWNMDSTRIFNYGTDKICPLDYSNDFFLEVWDTVNDRHVTAITKFIPAVPITRLEVEFNLDTIALGILGCNDNLNEDNYYRFILHKNSLSKKDPNSFFKYVAENPKFDQVIDDQSPFSTGEISHISNYEFFRTDSLIGTIYHIDQTYHDYLTTSRQAEEANLNPFVKPSGVLSNVDGGHGIFTFLSYDRDTLYIPW